MSCCCRCAPGGLGIVSILTTFKPKLTSPRLPRVRGDSGATGARWQYGRHYSKPLVRLILTTILLRGITQSTVNVLSIKNALESTTNLCRLTQLTKHRCTPNQIKLERNKTFTHRNISHIYIGYCPIYTRIHLAGDNLNITY